MHKVLLGIIVVGALLFRGPELLTLVLYGPGALEKNRGEGAASLREDDGETPNMRKCRRDKDAKPVSVRIQGDRYGHFNLQAKLNGKRVKVLVDTGASSVAINAATAKRIGLKIRPKDYRGYASTANGTVRVASANVKQITVGKITVCNVRVAVLPDSSLDGTLLGMTFLKKLKGFEVRGNVLTMRR